MAKIPDSIGLTAIIAPKDSADIYAVLDPIYGIDGWRSVPDITARDAITTKRRREGMSAWVQSEGTWYVLQGGITNSNW